MSNSVANDLLKHLAASGHVTREQVHTAQAELKQRGGLPWTHLVAAGVPPAEVLSALSNVTQLPAAPVERLRKATRAITQGIDGAAAWRLLAVPFANENGALEVAYADPRAVVEGAALFPHHKAFVAHEAHVRTLLNGLFGPPPHASSEQAATGVSPPPPAVTSSAPSSQDVTVTASAQAAKAPDQIGPFKLLRKVGEGGMADVYLAQEAGAPRPIALKVMRDHLTNDATFVQRFAHEARATVGMRHENIVEVLSYGDQGGRYYMACEYVDGGTVEQLLEKMGRLPAPLAAEIFAQMMSGLSFAHGKITVHRDLKPANLLMNLAGRVKVSDFGIAKTEGGAALTQTGLLIGTAAFMSPEQAQGQQVDSRSDLFTCGTILFHLLTGLNPFDAESPTTSILRIISGAYPLLREHEPAVPTVLEEVVEKLMQKDAATRYATAADVLADLQPYLAEVRARYPNLIADALAQPLETKQRLLQDQAQDLVEQAKPLIGGNPGEKARAALLLFRANRLSPDHGEAPALFADIVQRESFRFGPSSNAKITELEQVLQKTPDAPGPLQQLAQLYRMEGNLERAVVYLKRYLRVRPKDGYAHTQLSQLTGEKVKVIAGATASARSGSGASVGEATGALLAGIKTGGFVAAAKTEAETRETPMVKAATSASATTPAPDGVTFYEAGAEPNRFDWKVTARKVAPYVIGLLVVFGVIRGISRFIDSATEETADKGLALAEAIAKDRATSAPFVQKARQQEEQSLRETGSGELRAARKLSESARAAYDEGRYADAISSANMLLQDHPRSSAAENARMVLANAYLKLGQTFEAQRELNAYLSAYPGGAHYAEAVLRRGELVLKAGQPRQAIGDFTEVVNSYATTPYAAEALLLRAQTRASLGEKDDARSDLRLAEARAGQGTPLRARIAEELRKLGD